MKKLAQTPAGHIVKELNGFLHNFVHNVPTVNPSLPIESSFKIYPDVRSQYAQGVYSKPFPINSQFGPILPQALNKLIEYAVEYSYGWVYSKRTLDEWLRWMAGVL